MPYADVNGQRLWFEDSGGDGPPVVLSHGFLMDHTMFDRQVEALAPEFRCIRWDERGFGRTEDDGKAFTYWDSASDALGLMDHLGIDRAVLGGMSQGGFLSLRAALTSPDRVRALVLMDTGSDCDDDETLAAYQGMHDAWVSPDTSPEEHRGIADIIASIIIGDPGESKQWVDAWEAEPRERLRLPYACLVGREDITDRLGEITCPALIIHGTADAAISLERAGKLRDGLGDVRGFVEVEGGSHASNMVKPEVVNPPLLAFLRELP
jgi:pimeloyl-ACP methyl ester carboxylesterase